MASLRKRIWTRCQLMPTSITTAFEAAGTMFQCILEETLKHEPVARMGWSPKGNARLLDGAGPFASEIASEAS